MSRPWAKRRMVSVFFPKRGERKDASQAARSPMVLMPKRVKREADLAPMPKMREIGRGAMREAASLCRMMTRPLGFLRSLASFARNLLGCCKARFLFDAFLDAEAKGGDVTYKAFHAC